MAFWRLPRCRIDAQRTLEHHTGDTQTKRCPRQTAIYIPDQLIWTKSVDLWLEVWRELSWEVLLARLYIYPLRVHWFTWKHAESCTKRNVIVFDDRNRAIKPSRNETHPSLLLVCSETAQSGSHIPQRPYVVCILPSRSIRHCALPHLVHWFTATLLLKHTFGGCDGLVNQPSLPNECMLHHLSTRQSTGVRGTFKSKDLPLEIETYSRVSWRK